MSTTQERLDRQLLNACRYGHVSEVDILLSKGANIHYSDEDDPFGATCLSEASRRGKSEIVQLLIDKGVSVNDKISHDITALHLACERGHINVVQVLLNNKCESCPAELFNLDTPLHYAAANDHDEICKLLVEQGNVNVNIQNRTGDTPLHIAVANDRLKSTTMLLKLNGDLGITNHAEMTPIIVAQLAKCKQAIEAMQPFIDKMQQDEEKEKKEKQEKYQQSRKNTIRKTMDLTNSRKSSKISKSGGGGGNSAFDAPNMVQTDPLDELKYQSDDDDTGPNNKGNNRRWGNHLMSGKRDVVFKKGFLQKQGKKFKHFHERYFILWSNGLMHYYSNEHTIFASYVEKSKSNKNSDSHDGSNNNSLKIGGKGGQSPIKSSKTSIHDDDSMAFDSEDENNSFPKIPSPKKRKPAIKRKSTFAKLGLKSDTIKPKGIIDINDLIETQFLEFTDNSPGWALITPEREWKFKCSSDRERREWIAAVHAVNYGISPYDFQNLGYNISYKHNTMLLEPSQNSFIKQTSQMSQDENSNAIAQGWMYKLGAAVRGLEQNYWKKRWVSLYKKPARLAYAQHPYSLSDLENTPTTRSSIIPKSSPADLEDTDTEQSLQQPTKAQPSVNGTKKKVKKSNIVKGVIQLNDVTNIIRIGDNDLIKNKYRAPTVHVFALITEKRTWVFACKTAEECQMWYDRIAFFLPDQWKNDNKGVNVDELLRFNRVKTMAGGDMNNDEEDDQKGGDNHLSVNNGGKRKKSGGDDTVMSKVFRKISNVSQSLGFTEEYSTISGVQPKGTITDYNDAMDMMDDNNNNSNTNYVALQDGNENDEQ